MQRTGSVSRPWFAAGSRLHTTRPLAGSSSSCCGSSSLLVVNCFHELERQLRIYHKLSVLSPSTARTFLYCIVWYCTVWYYRPTVWCCTAWYCTVWHCTVRYCMVLYCMVLTVVLYGTVLYDTALYGTVLYGTGSGLWSLEVCTGRSYTFFSLQGQLMSQVAVADLRILRWLPTAECHFVVKNIPNQQFVQSVRLTLNQHWRYVPTISGHKSA